MADEGFYAALVPLAAAELADLAHAEEPELAELQIDDVRARRDGVVVTFRHPQRPGQLFGWRWSWSDGPPPDELGFAAVLLRVNLEEDLLSDRYELPLESGPDGISWI